MNTTQQKPRDPFWEGYDAYDADKGIEDNPYSREPMQWDEKAARYRDAYHQWIHGWETAENDANDLTD